MKKELENFLNEISNIQTLLSLWNLHKAHDWYRIQKTEKLDTISIVLTPRDEDYIINGHIENIEEILKENSKLSWHTYHIGVTSFLVEHKKGHMITAIAPQIILNFHMHETEE